MAKATKVQRPPVTDEMLANGDLARLWLLLLRDCDGNGEIDVSPRQIAKDLQLSYQRVRTLLKRLELTQLLTQSSTQLPTQRLTHLILRISASSAIQPTQLPTQLLTQSSTQLPTQQTGEKRPKKFIPPTDAEVADYVKEKGYHFNPESFVPHYQRKGWKVGKEPMSDWKACCRTWEVSWKEKYGEQFYYEAQQRHSAALPSQNGRYSELERAADTILFNAPYGIRPENDTGRDP